MKTITIKIDLSGKTAIEANGFTDSSCKGATEAIMRALAGKAEVKNKPEAYVTPKAQQVQSQYGY